MQLPKFIVGRAPRDHVQGHFELYESLLERNLGITTSSDPDVLLLHDFRLKFSLWLEARLTTELANDAASSSTRLAA